MQPVPHVTKAWESTSANGAARPASDSPERSTLGATTGFPMLEQTVIELAGGESLRREPAADEEVLFVLSGTGALEFGGGSHPLEAECGVHLAPGESGIVSCAGEEPLRLVSVRIPDPATDSPAGDRNVVRELAEQEAQDASAEREFRIVADPDSGLRSATHFVGYIPPGRAPIHFHTYDEVIYVLDGEGVLHAGGASTPIGVGSCVQLPARSLHCLENSGASVMRVEAVFRPAGSPAAAYYPDGTPAYYSAPTLGP
jgi:mannose-6-phosphate isomerase-like protein (cupin superfamily)